ncbi:MAG TPA: UDP-N-acetylglucosamine 2-epimerase (non-hydrolyzing) [Acidobacteriota bacterium]|nr:UDP-N-acetylglucosamine 2-epimerase (non-hydrolyzing) [Acidobacteriota bacterium]
MTCKILSVVGARPNFMKMAAICDAIREYNRCSTNEPFEHLLVHTGQHYDANMSDFFFSDLELPKPNLFLGVGSGSHSVQSAKVMEAFERVLLTESPNFVVVVGDVNSTVACALVTKKTHCSRDGSKPFIPKLVHVEAGLRSFDRTMPEEVNRIVTDAISDYLFTTEVSANLNLEREGIPREKIHFVGNVMIDTLLRHRSKAMASKILSDLQLVESGSIRPYAILTLHRPANVDDSQIFSQMLEAFIEISQHMPIIFPVHPRTLKQIRESHLANYFVDHVLHGPTAHGCGERIRMVPPLGYLDFLQLMSHAQVVLTDSGGVQEETTILRIPCLTLRDNTERPVTLQQGTNVLVGTDPQRIILEFSRVLHGTWPQSGVPKYWDGHAAKRIVHILTSDQTLAELSVAASPMEPTQVETPRHS